MENSKEDIENIQMTSIRKYIDDKFFSQNNVKAIKHIFCTLSVIYLVWNAKCCKLYTTQVYKIIKEWKACSVKSKVRRKQNRNFCCV